MATGLLPLLLIGALSLAVLATGGYACFQVSAYRRLERCYARLVELKLGQRQLYRRLEALVLRWERLMAQAPHRVRAAPYAETDERAIAVCRELAESLDALRQGLCPVEAGPLPRLRLGMLLKGSYRSQLEAATRQLAAAEGLLQQVSRAEGLADELEGLLAEAARKPLIVQRGLADVQALAEALAQEVEREQQRGTEGLVPLQYEVQAVRAAAMSWVERLRTARAAEAPQMAIEAEVLRPQLLARLAQAQGQAEQITGVHEQALGGQERLAEALASAEAMAGALRPLLADAVRPAFQALYQARSALALRYREHDAAAYQHVVQRSWVLLAQTRALAQRIERLAEADHQVSQAAEECGQALDELRNQVQMERRQAHVELETMTAALRRAEQAVAQLNALWPGGAGKQPMDEAGVTTLLGHAEAQTERCREEIRAVREALSAWRDQRRRVQEARARLAAADSEHQRLARAWQDLLGFAHANWAQVDPAWYERYSRERQAIMEQGARIWADYDRGALTEAAMAEAVALCDELVQRWQALAHQGQWVTTALAGARSMQRQVSEGLNALRPELQEVARQSEELPQDALAAPLRGLAADIRTHYRALEQESLRPADADYRRLRDEGLVRLQEELAAWRQDYAKLVDDERVELRRRMRALWQLWEPLHQRLVRAVPASDIEWRALAKRCRALSRTTCGEAATLKQIVALQALVATLTGDVTKALGDLEVERKAVREAEQQVALAREAALRRRGYLSGLLKHPHPQVVDEEWARSDKAWHRGELILRQLEPRRGAGYHVARLVEATSLYDEAGARARSALVRLLRYAFLEDPEGMRLACQSLGARWEAIGVTAREEHIRDLFGDLEQKGDAERLVENVTAYLNERESAR